MRIFLFLFLIIQVSSAKSDNSDLKTDLVHQWAMTEEFKAFLDANMGQIIVYQSLNGKWYSTFLLEKENKDGEDHYVGVYTEETTDPTLLSSDAAFKKNTFKLKGSGNDGGSGLAGDIAGSALKSGALILLEEGVLDLLGIKGDVEKYSKEIAENQKAIAEHRLKMRELFGLIYQRVATFFNSDVITKNALLIKQSDLKSLDQGHVDYLKELLSDMNTFTNDDGSLLNQTIEISESTLKSISATNPRLLKIRIIGAEFLKHAKFSAGIGTIGDAVEFAKFAKGIADMANHTLSPISDLAGIYYDLYESLTGYSATSSYKLLPIERSFSFYKFISNTGLGKKFKWATKTMGKVVNKIPGARAGWAKTIEHTKKLDQFMKNSNWKELWKTWGDQIESSTEKLKFIEKKFRKFQKLTDKWEIFFEIQGDQLIITAKDSEGVLPDKVYFY